MPFTRMAKIVKEGFNGRQAVNMAAFKFKVPFKDVSLYKHNVGLQIKISNFAC